MKSNYWINIECGRLIFQQSNLLNELGKRFHVDGVVLMLCKSGYAVLSADFKKRPFRKGDFAIIPYEMTMIPIAISKDFLVQILSVPIENSEEAYYRITNGYFWDYLYMNPIFRITDEHFAIVSGWFSQMGWIAKSHLTEYTNDLITGNVNSMFYMLYSELKKHLESINDRMTKGHPHILSSQFSILLTRYYTKHREVNWYASQMSITPDYLCKLTYRFCKMSPKEMIDRQVLSAIKTYLVSTDLSVKEIAINLHYDDPSYMCRFFKKLTGMSPLQFRNNEKSRNNKPCVGKLLRLDMHFRASTLDFVFYLSASLTLP